MAFDQLLKRHFWAVPLVLIGGVAFLNAQGLTQLIGSTLAADDKALAQPPIVVRGSPSASGNSARATNAEAILSRNPFDSVKGALNKVEEPVDAGAELTLQEPEDPFKVAPCEGVKVLVITASTDPDWSFAAFSQGEKSVLRRRGGDVSGKKVVFVGWDRVWLQNGVTLCQAEMFRSANQPVASAAPAAPAPIAPAAPGGPGAVPPEIAKGIVRVSANEFNVDRGVVDRILENQSDLMRQARIVPEQENGKVVGIRLFGVRPDTLLGALGMENGDRLQTINGFDMASPEKALEAYARLRTADHLTVQVNRRGQNTNLDFNIK